MMAAPAHNRIDLAGQCFGEWTVLSFISNPMWLCRCSCGAEMPVDGGSLRSGRTQRCRPCKMAIGSRTTHGRSKTRLYNIWLRMRERCTKPSDAAYDRYGGRGISVDAQWALRFEAFCAWALENGYRDDLTIDRIDNDGNYAPENCRWATYAEQNRNYSRNRPIHYQGRVVLACDLAIECGLPQDVLKNRILRYGWPVEKAVATPVMAREKREPWAQFGMSKSSYYRARAAGTLPILGNIDTLPRLPADGVG